MVKSVFITGSSGYLGHFLIDSFISKGFTCYIYCRDRSSLKFSHPNIIPLYSIDPYFFLLKQITIDAVLHVGSPASHQTTDLVIEECLIQAKQIVHFITALNIPTLLFFSTIHVYGDNYNTFTEDMPLNPMSPYGLLKSKLEDFFYQLSHIHSFDFVTLRLSNVIGPPYAGFRNWHLVFHNFLRSCVFDHTITIKSNPLLSRDFITIEFLLFYIHNILLSPCPVSCLNLTSGNSLTLNDLSVQIRDRFCELTALDSSSVQILHLNSPTSVPSRIYDNSRLISHYGHFANDISSQIDLSLRYFTYL